jgi:hypothetical protein
MWHKLNKQFKDREPARGYTLQQKVQDGKSNLLGNDRIEVVDKRNKQCTCQTQVPTCLDARYVLEERSKTTVSI